MYQHFYLDLLALCSKFFDDEHDIITAMNNGMLQVFNNIEKYDAAKGNLQGWVYTVVRNAAISYLRQQKLTPTTYELGVDMQIESTTNLLQDCSEELIYTFLKSLTLSTRAVFNLFYVEGFLIREIATALNMKEGTVKWHLNDGRNKLKQHFATNKQIVYANQ